MPVTIDGTSGVNTPSLTTSGSTVPVNGLYLPTTNTLGLATNSVERVRIDASGNLGIGATSPGYKLEVYRVDLSGTRTSPVDIASISAASTYSTEAYTGFGAGLVFKSAYYGSSTPVVSARIRNKINDDSVTSFGSSIAFDVTATRGGSLTQAMELNYAGNLGLGVVPSGWGSAWRAIQLGTQAAWYTNNDFSRLSLNVYGDSVYTERYLQTDHASQYIQASGNHTFMGADSGTAGNAITWTTMLNFKKDNTVALQGANFVAGTGITFPATQSASSDANTLDDYEEGTWTPSIGGTATYTARTGTYRKIGSQVTCWFDVTINAVGTGSGALQGLPFANNASAAGGGNVGYFASLVASFVMINPIVAGGQTSVSFETATAATATIGDNQNIWQNSSRCTGFVTYHV